MFFFAQLKTAWFYLISSHCLTSLPAEDAKSRGQRGDQCGGHPPFKISAPCFMFGASLAAFIQYCV